MKKKSIVMFVLLFFTTACVLLPSCSIPNEDTDNSEGEMIYFSPPEPWTVIGSYSPSNRAYDAIEVDDHYMTGVSEDPQLYISYKNISDESLRINIEIWWYSYGPDVYIQKNARPRLDPGTGEKLVYKPKTDFPKTKIKSYSVGIHAVEWGVMSLPLADFPEVAPARIISSESQQIISITPSSAYELDLNQFAQHSNQNITDLSEQAKGLAAAGDTFYKKASKSDPINIILTVFFSQLDIIGTIIEMPGREIVSPSGLMIKEIYKYREAKNVGEDWFKSSLYPTIGNQSAVYNNDIIFALETAFKNQTQIAPEAEELFSQAWTKKKKAHEIMVEDVSHMVNTITSKMNDQNWKDSYWLGKGTELLPKVMSGVIATCLGGPIVPLTKVGWATYDMFSSFNTLHDDGKVVDAALANMVMIDDAMKRIKENTKKSIFEFSNGIIPKIAQGDVIEIVDICSSDESYTDVTIRNTGKVETSYFVSARYSNTYFELLVPAACGNVSPGNQGVARVYYTKNGTGIDPPENAKILLQITGLTEDGLYYIDSKEHMFEQTN